MPRSRGASWRASRAAAREVVLLNAAAALAAAGKAERLEDGLRLAAHSIDSGAARQKLERLVEFTRGTH